ncbi:alpha/beta fold hydrolase [Comamonas sp. JC664]|uniref:alpha/beta hydrolase family protein n=1 Tax=Comamonas sp. JC664 TaxID=2801917 RepID=UPI00191CF754|nr:alpha/beta fold hydrolase [Comamonas sp. JC664]MBL0694386.1 alpha/beta fold hydrolase [Comamonas sp. JC664]GHG77336.1 dienelactone hydrolase [Comamonas sp. KCTC 72670]
MFRRSHLRRSPQTFNNLSGALGACVLGASLLTGGCATSKPAPTEAQASSAASPYGADATHAVGYTLLTFEDPARQRTLKTVLWYPTAPDVPMVENEASPIFARFHAVKDAPVASEKRQWPLVVLSHGNGGEAINMAWFGAHLAAHGFMVVSVNHPGNSYGDTSPEGYVRGWERPRDFTALLDGLLAHPSWGPRVDPERIGAAGHSMGGYTALALVGARLNLKTLADICTSPVTRDHPGCEELRDVDYSRIDFAEARASYKDSRVRAAFAMAPGMAGTYEARDVADITAPVALVLAKGDELMPHEENGVHLAKLLPAAKTVVLDDAAHFTFLPECAELGFKVAPMLCQDAKPGTRAASHARTNAEAVTFFRRTLVAQSW